MKANPDSWRPILSPTAEKLSWGDFVYTLDTVDIATGWTEQRAIWGKGETEVIKQIQDIEDASLSLCSALTAITALNSLIGI